MTSKLAVTAFAMSLALAGCGGGGLSNANGGKDATALTPDSRAADAAKPVDGVSAPGPEAGQPDVAAADVARSEDRTPGMGGQADLASDVVPLQDLGPLPPDTGSIQKGGGADVRNTPDLVTVIGDLGQDQAVDAPDANNDAPSAASGADANASEAGSNFDGQVQDLGVADVMADTGPSTPACPNGPSCGGSVVGTWNVTSSCLTLSGNMDVSLIGMGCSTVPVVGSLQVTGTWTAKANGTYTDNTTTKGSITFPLSPACLTVSSVQVECSRMGGVFQAQGWTVAACSTNASGQCICSATANQPGGIGVVSPFASTSGDYTTSGSGLTTDSFIDYWYCVSGNTLTLTPKPTILPVTGTVVLQKN
jgi:hypothetical protein